MFLFIILILHNKIIMLNSGFQQTKRFAKKCKIFGRISQKVFREISHF